MQDMLVDRIELIQTQALAQRGVHTLLITVYHCCILDTGMNIYTLDVHMDAQLDIMELTWVGRHTLTLMCMRGDGKANSKIQSSPYVLRACTVSIQSPSAPSRCFLRYDKF